MSFEAVFYDSASDCAKLTLGLLTLVGVVIVNSLIGPFFYHSIHYNWIRVVHSQYGFAFQYPEKWSYTLYGDSGYHGFHEAKARLEDNVFFGPMIRIAVFPIDNLDTDEIEELHTSLWRNAVDLTEMEIGGKVSWRSHILYESGSLIELVYFKRSNDIILIEIYGNQSAVENSRTDIEEFLKRFEPYAR